MIPEPPPHPVQTREPVNSQPMQPTNAGPTPSWPRSHRKALLAIIVVLVVVFASLGLVYTQPWSKVKVLVAYSGHGQIGLNVYLDGRLVASLNATPSPLLDYWTLGVWRVIPGSHNVSVDCGRWVDNGYSNFSHWVYSGPDGVMDIINVYYIGPLFTQNDLVSLG